MENLHIMDGVYARRTQVKSVRKEQWGGIKMGESTPLVSVIMPTYNDEKYVKAAIESILEQTLDDLELIIVNDGSTDRTREVIVQITDPRIKFIDNRENRGRPYARNCGLEIAKGKYIAVMDADDIALPDKLSKQYRYMEDNPNITCCGTFVKVLRGTRVYSSSHIVDPDELQATMLWCSPLAHSTWFIRGSEMKSTVRYDERFPLSQDYELIARMMGRWKLGCVPEELLIYRASGKRKAVDPYTVKVIERILRLLHVKNAKQNALLIRRFDLGYVDTITEKITVGILMLEVVKKNKQYQVFDQAALKKVIYRHVMKR